MNRAFILIFAFSLWSGNIFSQQNLFSFTSPVEKEIKFFAPDFTTRIHSDKVKTKPVMYNSLGYQIPLEDKDIVIGGTSIAYKRWGFCLSYKLGVKNFFMPDGPRGEFTYDNVILNNSDPTKKKWEITSNIQHATVGMLGGGLTIPITKKIPIYFGPGVTFRREFFQYRDPSDSTFKWNDNPGKSGFQMNYLGGIFIPIIGRLVLNVEYNYNPQSIYVGLVIRDRFVYDDIELW
ncbi:MAG: hypothetical protein ACHQK8_01695 [Bacteroidia bacterium]